MNDRQRAIEVARRWIDQGEIDPRSELALVAREFLNEVSSRDNDAGGIIELPPLPLNRKAQ